MENGIPPARAFVSTPPVSASARPAAGGWRDGVPAALLLLAGLAGLGAAWLVPGNDNGQYLVIAAPGASRGQVLNMIVHAHGSLAAEGRLGNVALARPDGGSGNAFARRLRAAGAWVAMPAPQQGGCLEFLTRVDRSQ